MNKNFKLTSLICAIILGTTLFITGCGSKVEKPEVLAEAYYNLYILGDSAKIQENGLKEDEVKAVEDAQRKATKDQTRKNFTTGGFTVSDEQLDSIVDAQKAALAKLTVKTETVSEDKDKASVKITTNYIDITEADKKAADDALAEVQALGLTNQEELKKEFVNSYVKKIIENISNVEPSTETVDKTFDFELVSYDIDGKKQKIWTPSDMTAFGTQIATMASGSGK